MKQRRSTVAVPTTNSNKIHWRGGVRPPGRGRRGGASRAPGAPRQKRWRSFVAAAALILWLNLSTFGNGPDDLELQSNLQRTDGRTDGRRRVGSIT